jgi:hypothetical protein
VLTLAGNVDCWGSNWAGQSDDYLGGNAVAVSAGTSHTCAVLASGNVECWGGYETCHHDCYGPADDYLGGDAVGVSVGYGHSCFLLAGGDVDCAGANWMHEEELDSDPNQAADDLHGDAIGVEVGDFHSCLATVKGTIRCWGGSGTDYPAPSLVADTPQEGDAIAATACTPDVSAWVYPRDVDGDGIPAAYTKRNDKTTVDSQGGVTQRPGSTYCWLAGDPDDDGKWRGPALDTPVAPTSWCAPSAASKPVGADKDGDGIPAQYVRGATRVRYEGGAVAVTATSSECWLFGDPDDDGRTRP